MKINLMGQLSCSMWMDKQTDITSVVQK